jgi:hypothetical protein
MRLKKLLSIELYVKQEMRLKEDSSIDYIAGQVRNEAEKTVKY